MIPRTLHFVWTGPPLPIRFASFIERWGDLHPDWEVRLWDDRDLDWLSLRDLYDRAEELSPRNLGQFRADIARLEILLRHGGVYVDCDMDPVRPIDELVAREECLAAWYVGWGRPWVGNAFLAAEPGHPVIASLVSGIPRSIGANPGKRCVYTTGPRYITGRLEADGLMDRLTILEPASFYPYGPADAASLDARPASSWFDSWAVHRWHNRLSGGWTGDAA